MAVMRFDLGLKLWATDVGLAEEARSLVRRGVYSYIELFAVPGALDQTLAVWRGLDGPYVIHAAHSMKGLNPAKRELRAHNKGLAEEARRFADALGAECIIFHPGVDGPVDESVRQLRSFADPRILVENKPKLGLDGSLCVGWSPEEMEALLQGTGYGFCLDFGHAHCAAVSSAENPETFVRSFLSLCPAMYHMTDGQADAPADVHHRYGLGTLPLPQFLSSVPDGARITNEGERRNQASLAEAEEDAAFLRAVDWLSWKPGALHMKRARAVDLDAVYELSNQPEVRASSFSSEPISYERHVEWYKAETADEDVRFFVFFQGRALVGQTRFRRESADEFCVSVSVSREFRGSGVSRPIMQASILAMTGVRGVGRLKAYIKKGNEVSIRYFSALGFIQESAFPKADRSLLILGFEKARNDQ